MDDCDLAEVMREVGATAQAVDSRRTDTRTLVMFERLPRMLGNVGGRLLALADKIRAGTLAGKDAADELSAIVAK